MADERKGGSGLAGSLRGAAKLMLGALEAEEPRGIPPKGAPIARDEPTRSLMLAASAGDLPSALSALGRGADIGAFDPEGHRPFERAYLQGRAEAGRALAARWEEAALEREGLLAEARREDIARREALGFAQE